MTTAQWAERAGAPASSTGTRTASGNAYTREMSALQMDLTARLTTLGLLIEELAQGRRWPATEAYVRAVGRSLIQVRRALHQMLAGARRSRAVALIAAESPLRKYVRGVYAWSGAILSALEDLLVSARERRPRWIRFQERMEEARRLLPLDDDGVRRHFAQLRRSQSIPREVDRLALTAFGVHLDELLFAASRLAHDVDVSDALRRVNDRRR